MGDGDICHAGGFREARDRTLDLLAKACSERDIREVQRLAAMTLTWHAPPPASATGRTREEK